KAGRTFERRGVIDVSALLCRLLGFGVPRCPSRRRPALQFSWNENCACAGDRRDFLDSYPCDGSRVSGDWNSSHACVDHVFRSLSRATEMVGKMRKPTSLSPCVTTTLR